MSTRSTVVIFIIIFLIGIFFVVIIPFFFINRPSATKPGSTKKTEAVRDQGVFRSDDGGETWSQKAFIEGSSASIATLAVNRVVQDPVDPETIYLLTNLNGLWVSRSRGDLWAKVTDSSEVLDPLSDVLAMAVNPADNKQWFVASFQKNRGRLLITEDAGRTFREAYFTPLERFGIFDVVYNQDAKAIDIVTGQGGFLESRDLGRTWRVVRWFADGLLELLVDPTNRAVEYVITPRGSIFRTTDSGGAWADVTDDLRSHSNATLNQRWLIDSAGGLYLGSNFGLLRSRDRGVTYRALAIILPPDGLPVLAVAVDSKNTRRIFASALNQLYRSEDDGETWAILKAPTANRIVQLLIDREDPKIMYAVVAQ